MFEIGRQRSRGWMNFGRSWTREVGSLENWRRSGVFIFNFEHISHLALVLLLLILNIKCRLSVGISIRTMSQDQHTS